MHDKTDECKTRTSQPGNLCVSWYFAVVSLISLLLSVLLNKQKSKRKARKNFWAVDKFRWRKKAIKRQRILLYTFSCFSSNSGHSFSIFGLRRISIEKQSAKERAQKPRRMLTNFKTARNVEKSKKYSFCKWRIHISFVGSSNEWQYCTQSSTISLVFTLFIQKSKNLSYFLFVQCVILCFASLLLSSMALAIISDIVITAICAMNVAAVTLLSLHFLVRLFLHCLSFLILFSCVLFASFR